MMSLDELKKEQEYKKSSYYDLYKRCKEHNLFEIKNCASCLKKYQKELEELRLNNANNLIIERAENELNRWKFSFDRNVNERECIRPNTLEDIKEREDIINNFSKELQSILKDNTNLRFHATPIYNAKKIIETGHITSSADRYNGYLNSTDLKGEFSASKVSDVNKSIDFYMDVVAYQRSMPCGALFILKERVGDDALRGIDTMQNVDIRNGNSLEAIVTTKENKDMLMKLCITNGIDYKKVYNFNEFLEHAKIIYKEESETFNTFKF